MTAGIILRFHDADNCVVGLDTPSLNAIYIHDRTKGEWGSSLGGVAVPEIGPTIRLTASACGNRAGLIVTDGKDARQRFSNRVGSVSPMG